MDYTIGTCYHFPPSLSVLPSPPPPLPSILWEGNPISDIIHKVWTTHWPGISWHCIGGMILPVKVWCNISLLSDTIRLQHHMMVCVMSTNISHMYRYKIYNSCQPCTYGRSAWLLVYRLFTCLQDAAAGCLGNLRPGSPATPPAHPHF